MSSARDLATQPRFVGQDAPERVVIFRPLGLEGLLTAVPALRALRTALPSAALTYIGDARSQPAAGRFGAYIDDFMLGPYLPGLSPAAPDAGGVVDFLRRAQARRFDLALQLHGCGLISNPFTVLLGAERTAGYYLPGQYCPDPETFLIYPWHLPEVQRPLLLLETLGVPAQGEDLEFPLEAVDWQVQRQVKQSLGLETLRYACLQPACLLADQAWPVERFSSLADALEQQGTAVVLIGRRDEPGLTQQVASGMQTPGIDLGGQLPQGATVALVAHARFLVSGGGWLSRAAEALGVPQLILRKESAAPSEPPDSASRRVIGWAGLATPEMIVQELLELSPQELPAPSLA